MSRTIVLGNGNMLVGLGKHAMVRDLYFPHVGQENHIGAHCSHRIGVHVDDTFSWIYDGSWEVSVTTNEDSFEGQSVAVNEALGVELSFRDVVYNEKNIFLREIRIKNLRNEKRTIKLYIGHEFEIYESRSAHTAYFDPIHKVLVHYKAKRVFTANARLEGEIFHDHTTGVFGIEGKIGSYMDAEDGELHKNPIEHGPADSVLGLYGEYAPNGEKTAHYWLCVSKTIQGAHDLNSYALEKGPAYLIDSTANFWRAWISKRKFVLPELSDECMSLFKRSLYVVRVHTNNNGAVIASSDSDMLQKGKDTYSYVWPRDGAFSIMAMVGAGYINAPRTFFLFMEKLIDKFGHFMHKYHPDGSLGSSWHPWVRNGRFELPIQEDETALVIFALREYYEASRDIELVERLYRPLIARAADFMAGYRDEFTRLPKPSYDLWEERFGIHTFTAASVFGALEAAAYFAEMLGKEDDALRWRTAASEISSAIQMYLYNEENGTFRRMITVEYDLEHDLRFEKADIIPDNTVDISSTYGIFLFGVLPAKDKRLKRAFDVTRKALECGEDYCTGGLARYAGDRYQWVDGSAPGNPWFIATLWYAQYLITVAQTNSDLAPVRQILEWVAHRGDVSGMLAEQIHPHTGAPLSAMPLTWSHAEYVRTVLSYLSKLEEIGICKDCHPA